MITQTEDKDLGRKNRSISGINQLSICK